MTQGVLCPAEDNPEGRHWLLPECWDLRCVTLDLIPIMATDIFTTFLIIGKIRLEHREEQHLGTHLR